MFNIEDVKAFFDSRAVSWDEQTVRKEEVIEKILDNAGVSEGDDVLDVACGTGVLFSDYLKRKAGSITGIDVSPAMAEIARNKYENIKVICGNAQEYEFGKEFDVIVIYDAFPHFTAPYALFEALSKCLKKGGRITVAHSMSREALTHLHNDRANSVSFELPEIDELAGIMAEFFEVVLSVSDDCMYQVCAVKR
ncbi:MAG: class I SAM-dependent methyltransferase [Clostridia bacterium]|nr:class I SAM-dependent methyltransferase [Clostridia bacterium]